MRRGARRRGAGRAEPSAPASERESRACLPDSGSGVSPTIRAHGRAEPCGPVCASVLEMPSATRAIKPMLFRCRCAPPGPLEHEARRGLSFQWPRPRALTAHRAGDGRVRRPGSRASADRSRAAREPILLRSGFPPIPHPQAAPLPLRRMMTGQLPTSMRIMLAENAGRRTAAAGPGDDLAARRPWLRLVLCTIKLMIDRAGRSLARDPWRNRGCTPR